MGGEGGRGGGGRLEQFSESADTSSPDVEASQERDEAIRQLADEIKDEADDIEIGNREVSRDTMEGWHSKIPFVRRSQLTPRIVRSWNEDPNIVFHGTQNTRYLPEATDGDPSYLGVRVTKDFESAEIAAGNTSIIDPSGMSTTPPGYVYVLKYSHQDGMTEASSILPPGNLQVIATVITGDVRTRMSVFEGDNIKNAPDREQNFFNYGDVKKFVRAIAPPLSDNQYRILERIFTQLPSPYWRKNIFLKLVNDLPFYRDGDEFLRLLNRAVVGVNRSALNPMEAAFLEKNVTPEEQVRKTIPSWEVSEAQWKEWIEDPEVFFRGDTTLRNIFNMQSQDMAHSGDANRALERALYGAAMLYKEGHEEFADYAGITEHELPTYSKEHLENLLREPGITYEPGYEHIENILIDFTRGISPEQLASTGSTSLNEMIQAYELARTTPEGIKAGLKEYDFNTEVSIERLNEERVRLGIDKYMEDFATDFPSDTGNVSLDWRRAQFRKAAELLTMMGRDVEFIPDPHTGDYGIFGKGVFASDRVFMGEEGLGGDYPTPMGVMEDPDSFGSYIYVFRADPPNLKGKVISEGGVVVKPKELIAVIDKDEYGQYTITSEGQEIDYIGEYPEKPLEVRKELYKHYKDIGDWGVQHFISTRFSGINIHTPKDVFSETSEVPTHFGAFRQEVIDRLNRDAIDFIDFSIQDRGRQAGIHYLLAELSNEDVFNVNYDALKQKTPQLQEPASIIANSDISNRDFAQAVIEIFLDPDFENLSRNLTLGILSRLEAKLDIDLGINIDQKRAKLFRVGEQFRERIRDLDFAGRRIINFNSEHYNYLPAISLETFEKYTNIPFIHHSEMPEGLLRYIEDSDNLHFTIGDPDSPLLDLGQKRFQSVYKAGIYNKISEIKETFFDTASSVDVPQHLYVVSAFTEQPRHQTAAAGTLSDEMEILAVIEMNRDVKRTGDFRIEDDDLSEEVGDREVRVDDPDAGFAEASTEELPEMRRQLGERTTDETASVHPETGMEEPSINAKQALEQVNSIYSMHSKWKGKEYAEKAIDLTKGPHPNYGNAAEVLINMVKEGDARWAAWAYTKMTPQQVAAVRRGVLESILEDASSNIKIETGAEKDIFRLAHQGLKNALAQLPNAIVRPGETNPITGKVATEQEVVPGLLGLLGEENRDIAEFFEAAASVMDTAEKAAAVFEDHPNAKGIRTKMFQLNIHNLLHSGIGFVGASSLLGALFGGNWKLILSAGAIAGAGFLMLLGPDIYRSIRNSGFDWFVDAKGSKETLPTVEWLRDRGIWLKSWKMAPKQASLRLGRDVKKGKEVEEGVQAIRRPSIRNIPRLRDNPDGE